ARLLAMPPQLGTYGGGSRPTGKRSRPDREACGVKWRPAKLPEPAPRPGGVCADLYPRAGRDGLDELHGPGRAVLREEPLAATEQDRFDQQGELVDQSLGEQSFHQAAAAPDQQVATVLAA